jgi:hypothetical protein
MFKQGDVIEILEGAPYAVTKPGSKWLVYSLQANNILRVGPISTDKTGNMKMIQVYGDDSSRLHRDRRIVDNIKIYSVHQDFCKISGNNAVFKHVLSNEDPWEEEKKSKNWSRGKGYFTDGIDW